MPASSELRRIGWEFWDPIGIGPPDRRFEDEYDGYLLKAASMASAGASVDEAACYLEWVLVDHMCLKPAPQRSTRTAEEILALIGSQKP